MALTDPDERSFDHCQPPTVPPAMAHSNGAGATLSVAQYSSVASTKAPSAHGAPGHAPQLGTACTIAVAGLIWK